MIRNIKPPSKTKLLVLVVFLQVFFGRSHAQQFLNFDKEVDSASVKEYKQVLPIWGKKVIAKGFELPEPLGIAINYMHLKQGLLLENLLVGFEGVNNSLDPVNLDDFVNFTELSTIGNIYIVKPDIWLFPFMSVYGTLGYVDMTTKVVIDEPIEFATNIRTIGYNYGIGTTIAAGFKDWWVAGNFNWTWTKLTNLDNPTYTVVNSFRAGKAHDMGKKGKLTYWFGAMHQKWGKTVSGAFYLSDIFGDLPDATVPDQIRGSDNYLNLTPPQKAVVDPILDAMDEAGQGIRDNYDYLSLTYSVDKAPERDWNMIIGANLALSRHWYVQGEVGFIKKFSMMVGVNSRFHL